MRRIDRNLWPLVLVLLATAVVVSFMRREPVRVPSLPLVPREAAPVPNTFPTLDVNLGRLNGVAPGMTLEETRCILGPPGCKGPLQVAGGLGSYAEYGSSSLTWNGSPTLTFTPDGRVLSVVGTRFSVGGTPAFELRSNEKTVRDWLGSPTRDEMDQSESSKHCMTYVRPLGVLNVFVLRGAVVRMLWYAPQH